MLSFFSLLRYCRFEIQSTFMMNIRVSFEYWTWKSIWVVSSIRSCPILLCIKLYGTPGFNIHCLNKFLVLILEVVVMKVLWTQTRACSGICVHLLLWRQLLVHGLTFWWSTGNPTIKEIFTRASSIRLRRNKQTQEKKIFAKEHHCHILRELHRSF